MPRQHRGIRGDVGIAPYGREQGVRLHIGRVGQSPAPTHVYRTCTLPLPCHSEPVLTLAWQSVSLLFHASGGVLLPSAAKVPKNAVQTYGLKIPLRAFTRRVS